MATKKIAGRASGMKRGKPYTTSRKAGQRNDKVHSTRKSYDPLRGSKKTGKSPTKKSGGYI